MLRTAKLNRHSIHKWHCGCQLWHRALGQKYKFLMLTMTHAVYVFFTIYCVSRIPFHTFHVSHVSTRAFDSTLSYIPKSTCFISNFILSTNNGSFHVNYKYVYATRRCHAHAHALFRLFSAMVCQNSDMIRKLCEPIWYEKPPMADE